MARGGRRTYTRDANGRFASAPGGGGGKARRPAARKAVMRSGNRLTRDNRGRITSIGGDGATARGGRLRTASGGMRARQTAALRSTALRSGTIAKGGRGVSGSVARSLAAVKRERQGGSAASLTERKRANAVRKGLLRRTTEGERASAAQVLAREERKLREIIKNPPRNRLYGRDPFAVQRQQQFVESLRGPMPDYRRVDRSAIRQEARDRLARKRAEKQQRKLMRSLDTARKAGAYYRQTGTLPASERKGKAKSERASSAKPQAGKPGANPRSSTGRSRKQAATSTKRSGGYQRGVDAAKVSRIMDRVRATRSYQGATKRVRFAKENAGRATQQRAVDFLHKQAGFKKAGTSMGRTRWESPAGLTREQAMRNIAESLPKQPRRSTAKTGNKKVVTREQKRQQKVAGLQETKRSVFFQRAASSQSPAALRQSYDGSTGRGSRRMSDAAARQSKKREVVRRLRGLGPYNSSKVRRGATRQLTLGGGTRTTYGKFKAA